ncbi:hypothetical protein ABZP36_005823 [Zizania latifolia]
MVVGVPPVLIGASVSSAPELQGRSYLVHHIFYEDSSIDGVPPASQASIEALKEVEKGGECVICLESIDSCGKEMPCGHQFHKGCVERWLGIHGNCPLCRYEMPAAEEVVVATVHGERVVMRGRRVVLSVLVMGRPLGPEQGTPNVLIDDLD